MNTEKHSRHVSWRRLIQYFRNRLPEDEAMELEEHLADCDRCVLAANRVRPVVQFCHRLLHGVLNCGHKGLHRPSKSANEGFFFTPGIAALAGVVVVTGIGYLSLTATGRNDVPSTLKIMARAQSSLDLPVINFAESKPQLVNLGEELRSALPRDWDDSDFVERTQGLETGFETARNLLTGADNTVAALGERIEKGFQRMARLDAEVAKVKAELNRKALIAKAARPKLRQPEIKGGPMPMERLASRFPLKGAEKLTRHL